MSLKEYPLAVGDRVMPGPKWHWGDQGHKDGKPLLGTVIHISKEKFNWSTGKSETVYVLWDGDTALFSCEGGLYSNTYPMGEQGVVKAGCVPEYPAVRLTPLELQDLKSMEYVFDYGASSALNLTTPSEDELRESILKGFLALTEAYPFDAPPRWVPRFGADGKIVWVRFSTKAHEVTEPVELPPSPSPLQRFKEAMERQFRVDKLDKESGREPTEGERLAKFFATSEHDRARPSEHFDVTEARWSDASEPRNDLRDVLTLWSPTAPGYGERLYDAMATDAYRREEDRRAAELRETVAAIRDDFDNLPDA